MPHFPGPDASDTAAFAAQSEALAALYARPFSIERPLRQTVPFIFAVPHSGRHYPAEFAASSRLHGLALRRSEDAFVDSLVAGTALALGAPVIAARFPRAFLDVNRAPGELDPAMFAGELGLAVDRPGPRVQAGLGVIPRIVRDGAEIYRDKVPAADAAARLNRLYRPYHGALLGLVEATQQSFGTAVVIDCHSMPSAAAVPDIVLGDRYGVAAGAAVSARAQSAFELRAFNVVRNVPYAGGFTTQLYGRPGRGIHALQVEINRGLYLDEERILPSARFEDVRRRLAEALAQLAHLDPHALRPRQAPQDRPLAAE